MALKAVLDSLDGVAETAHSFYTEAEGKFVLDIEAFEDHPAASSLVKGIKAERANVKKANDAIKAMKDRYGDLDPDAARDALKKLAEGGVVADPAKVEAAINDRLTKAQAAWQQKIAAAEKEREELNHRLSEVLVDRALTEAASKAGIKPGALEDAINRAKRVWKLHEGEPTPMQGDEVIRSPRNMVDTLSMDEYFTDLAAKAPHLFEESRGGSAQGGGNRGTSGPKLVANTPMDIGRNLEAIAKGRAVVR